MRGGVYGKGAPWAVGEGAGIAMGMARLTWPLDESGPLFRWTTAMVLSMLRLRHAAAFCWAMDAKDLTLSYLRSSFRVQGRFVCLF